MSSPTTRIRNPWTWVPSSYFSEGIPFALQCSLGGPGPCGTRILGHSDGQIHARHGEHRDCLVAQAPLGRVPRHVPDEEILRPVDGDPHRGAPVRHRGGPAPPELLPDLDSNPLGPGLRLGHAGHLRGRHLHHQPRRARPGQVHRGAGGILERRPAVCYGGGGLGGGIPEAGPWPVRDRRMELGDGAGRRRALRPRGLPLVHPAHRLGYGSAEGHGRNRRHLRGLRHRLLPQGKDMGDAALRVPVPELGGPPPSRGTALPSGRPGRRGRRPVAQGKGIHRRHGEHLREPFCGSPWGRVHGEVRTEAEHAFILYGPPPEHPARNLCHSLSQLAGPGHSLSLWTIGSS